MTARNPRTPGALVAVAAGGILGATARYALARALPTDPGRFPWATFVTNVTGSFVLALLLIRFRPAGLVRRFAATGVLGAFTTMSTFEVETALLVGDGHGPTAVLYAAATAAVGLGAAYAGAVAGRWRA